MSNRQYFLQHFDRKYSRDFEHFSIGDFIRVGFLVQENEKKRLQFFEGIIIAIKGPQFGKKITLRGARIERIFCCQSPQIKTLNILKSQKFHRSKLYYLRKRIGKRVFG